MIACGFAVIARQWLNRRIPTIKEGRTQILVLLDERQTQQIQSAVLSDKGALHDELALAERQCSEQEISENANTRSSCNIVEARCCEPGV